MNAYVLDASVAAKWFYVALAITSGRPLLTADEKLANALAAHFPIRWLGSAAS